MAEQMKAVLKEKGYPFYLESPTNQQFVTLEDTELARLEGKVVTDFWEKVDATHTAVRFATSWATTEADIEQLRVALNG